MEEKKVGLKFDAGKPRYGLIPAHALEEVVKVLTIGAQKYSDDNWKIVSDGENRYFDGLMRHVWAFKRGEILDPETKLHHLAHGICNLLFLYEITTNLSTQNKETVV